MYEEGAFDTTRNSFLILLSGLNSFRRLGEEDLTVVREMQARERQKFRELEELNSQERREREERRIQERERRRAGGKRGRGGRK